MRVAPLGLYIKDENTAGKFAAESSALTHGHPLGIIPSYVLASMINLIVHKDLDILTSLNQSIHGLLTNYNIFNKEDTNYFIELMKKAIKLSSSNMNDIDAINELGEGWVAEEALAIAIYSCLKYSNSFEDAVVCAVNHDGDSDSTGAIAGNIIGAYLGEEAKPDYYKDNVELKDVILEIADDLSSPIPVSEYSSNNDEYWISKYVYCHKDNTKKSK
jgi:ADP-ribosylglycohydrolase